MKTILKKFVGVAAGAVLALEMTGCNNNVEPHEHTFATTYSSDATHHWYAATCEHTTEVKDKAAHTFGKWNNKKRTCVTCNYEQTCEHTFGNYVSNNDASIKADGTKTRICSVCGYEETVTDKGTKITEVTYKGIARDTAEFEFDFTQKTFKFMTSGEDFVKGTIPNDVTELTGEFELTVTHVIDYRTNDWSSEETIILELFYSTSIPISVNEDGSIIAEENGIPAIFEKDADDKYVCCPEYTFTFNTEEKTITVKYNDEVLEVMDYEGDISEDGTITVYLNDYFDLEDNPILHPVEVVVSGTKITGTLGYSDEITLVE